MAGLSTVGEYTRGSEVVSHYLAMFRASVARQTAFMLVLSAAAGVGSMAVEMGDARSHLPEYIDAWLREDVIADFERRIVGTSKLAGDRIQRLAPLFGGRSVPFLVKQVAIRTALCFFVGWPLLAAALIAVGKALRADRFLRGARLIDTTTRKYRQRHMRRAITMGLLCAFAGAVCLPLMVSGGNGVGVLRLLLAWLAAHVSSLAALLSPDGDGAVIWTYAGGQGGFFAPEQSYAALSDAVGWGVPELGVLCLLGTLAGAIAGPVWARRSRLAKQPTDPKALRVGGVVIPRDCEVLHFLVSGVVRAGKTVFINWLLDGIRDRGESGSCFERPAETEARTGSQAETKALARSFNTSRKSSLAQYCALRGEPSAIILRRLRRLFQPPSPMVLLSLMRQRVIAWDRKGEYIERYYRPGKDIILNPFDERSACWTPWADASDMAAYESLGKSLFPEDISHDKYWSRGGALIFAWLIERVGKRLWGKTGRPMRECPHNQELAYVLNHTEMEELQEELKDSPAARYMSEHAAGMSQSFLGTLATQLSPFLYLRNPREGERPFSIREFIQDESSDAWLFISVDPERFDAVRPLVSLWYDIAINAVLALPNNPSDVPVEQHRRIFCVLDELASLQVLPALDPALTVGPQKGLSAILGLQSLDQMKHTYGQNLAMTMLGMPQNRQILRTVESTTAKWLEDELGKREIERTTESQQMGADTQRDGVGFAKQRQLESLVVYSEIQALPKLTGYLSMAGEPVKKIKYTWPDKRGSEPGLVPVKTLPEVTPPPWTEAKGKIDKSEDLKEKDDADAALASETDPPPAQSRPAAASAVKPSTIAQQSSPASRDSEASVASTLVAATLATAATNKGKDSPDLDLDAELSAANRAIELATGPDRERLEKWAQGLRGRMKWRAICEGRKRQEPAGSGLECSADADAGDEELLTYLKPQNGIRTQPGDVNDDNTFITSS